MRIDVLRRPCASEPELDDDATAPQPERHHVLVLERARKEMEPEDAAADARELERLAGLPTHIMGRLSSFIVMTLLAIACRTSSTATASQPEAASASSVTAPPLVDIRPLVISFRGKPIARLFADGRTESSGQNAPGTTLAPGPTLHADGTIAMTSGGVTARLDPNGDIYVINPGATPRLFGHIAGDELAFAGDDRPWSVRVRGNMIEFGEDNSSQIDGDVTPTVRHTALVMAASFYIDGAIAPR